MIRFASFLPRSWASLALATTLATGAFLAPVVFSSAGAADTTSQLTLRWIHSSDAPNRASVEAAGFGDKNLQLLQRISWDSERWKKLLSVYAEQGNVLSDIGLPAMAGPFKVETGVIRFTPQFALQPGINYRAVLRPEYLPDNPSKPGTLISSTFKVPLPSREPTTTVTQIFPSAEVLPENLLKFYVHFSDSMSGGHIYEYIHLRDEKGNPVELPFLEIDEELWDPAMKRLTLFIDPGRIKRGVRPLEEIGPALEEGKRYVLSIDRKWRDAAGNPLKESFEKSFQVGPPDREPPNPDKWKMDFPKSHSRESLTVYFGESLDHALAQRMIRVTDDSGNLIDGDVALDNQEHRWKFVPSKPWQPAPYKLNIQSTIEDLAGNNIGKPFEVDLFDGVQRRLTSRSIQLPFEVR